MYRRLLKFTLEELRVIEDHLGELDRQMADLLQARRVFWQGEPVMQMAGSSMWTPQLSS